MHESCARTPGSPLLPSRTVAVLHLPLAHIVSQCSDHLGRGETALQRLTSYDCASSINKAVGEQQLGGRVRLEVWHRVVR